MGRKRHKPEEIIAKLRQVDVLTAQGTPVAEAIRSIGVTESRITAGVRSMGPLGEAPMLVGLAGNNCLSE
jgi:hypothetical protein